MSPRRAELPYRYGAITPGANGLLLTPSVGHLFDRGFIGFGDLIISPVAHRPLLERMGIDTRRVVNAGGFTQGRRAYLDFHRNAVLLKDGADSGLPSDTRRATLDKR